jgi:hypothetical protein
MNIKTSELTGAALDWAVDKAEGRIRPDGGMYAAYHGRVSHWSTDWTQGGSIIERDLISVSREFSSFTKGFEWAAWTPAPIRDDAESFGYGPTPLIAAMRCYVASKLGDTIDIPEELV